MSSFAPLVVTGPARSGTTLVALLLSAHPEVMVASDPYLPLFLSFRNAVLRRTPALEGSFDAAMPLQDYYYTDARIAAMDAIQQADLRQPFDPAEWETFLERSVARAGVMAPDLAARFEQLRGDNYRDIFQRAFEIVAAARDARRRRWVGFKDVWVVEFFGVLAAAFPDARFVVVMRDPRAIIASMLAIDDPTQVAQPLSYARHWRKHVAMIERYREDARLANRLHVMTLEDLVAQPEIETRKLCGFLDLDFDPAMLDASRYFDYATGERWTGNSSFSSGGHRLDHRVRRMTELVCGPDMELAGFATDSSEALHDPDVLEYLVETNERPVNWRSDLQDPQQDYGFELFRRALLARPADAPSPEESVLRRSFLFRDVYDRLRRNLPVMNA